MSRLFFRTMPRIFLAAVVVRLALLTPCGLSASAAAAELPRETVDTAWAPPSGRAIPARSAAEFQEALRRAQPGDAILLEAGAVFSGSFTLSRKSGAGWITIRSSAPDSSLPPPGARIDPSYAKAMPKIVSGSGPAIQTAPGAHHYRFVGVELRPAEGVFLHNLVQLGADEKALEDLPHHIIFDRCILSGDPKKGARRGIALNSRHTAVIDSHFSDFKEAGADSQAIAGWNGAGPFKIANNYLEAAGENVIFGGTDPAIRGLVPSDIEIRRNHFTKPLAWRQAPWTVKNLFELKNARRVLMDGNLLEHNWAQAQSGFAVLLTVRNQDGKAPWSVVEDVTFSNNIVRHAASGFNILGRDNNHSSQQTRRIRIANNLFEDIGGREWEC